MAPKSTKKSSLNTIPQTTSRQGLRQSQKQKLPEAQLSSQADNEADDMEVDAERSNQEDEEAILSSQSGTQEGLQQIIGNVVDEQRKRETDRKKKTHESYERDLQDVRGRINKVFDDHEQSASSIHNNQLKRLQDLLAHKAKVETAMERELARLQAEYEAHSKDLQTCIDRRIKEME